MGLQILPVFVFLIVEFIVEVDRFLYWLNNIHCSLNHEIMSITVERTKLKFLEISFPTKIVTIDNIMSLGEISMTRHHQRLEI